MPLRKSLWFIVFQVPADRERVVRSLARRRVRSLKACGFEKRYESQRPANRVSFLSVKSLLCNLIVVLSLLLSLANTALWVRTYSRTDLFWHVTPTRVFGLATPRASVIFSYRHSRRPGANLGSTIGFEHHSDPQVMNPSSWNMMTGFKVDDAPDAYRCGGGGFGYCDWKILSELDADRDVMIPLWFSQLMFAVLPMLWIVRRLCRSSSARPGRCTACGYDLRATPDRCPECGAGANRG